MKRVAAVLVCLTVAVNAYAAEAVSPRTARLAKLCKIWGSVKFLHPWVWTRDIDWDAALLQALPKARAAASDDEFAAAVGAMLGALHDPVTRVVPNQDGPLPAPPAGAPFMSWPQPGTLLVRLGVTHTPAELTKAVATLKEAKRVLLDLRVARGDEAWSLTREEKALMAGLITHEVRVPPVRWVAHDGYKPQNGMSSGGYDSLFEEQAVAVITPKPNAVRRPLAVVVNEAFGEIDEAMALQGAGEAAVVVQGATLDDLATSGGTWPLDAKHGVRLRQFEIVPVAEMPRAAAELPAEADDKRVIDTALAKLAALAPAHARPTAPPRLPPLVWRPDKDYATEKAPSVELRLLSLFRLWNVIDRFYPYKQLLDEPWDDVLTTFIPRFEAAESAHAYVEVVAELSTHVADTHTGLRGGDDVLLNVAARPQLLAQMIEGQPVIVALGSDAETVKAGLHLGDVILSVDGEPMVARLSRLHRFVAGSNEPARQQHVLARALGGAEGSTATLVVRDAAGKSHEAKLVRLTPKGRDLSWRTGDVVRVLDGNIGYVDLDRLMPAEVEAMFAKLKDTRAIVFDMRGYPNGIAWSIAPRLNVRGGKLAAVFERCFVRWGDADTRDGIRFKFTQPLPTKRDEDPLYRGKTVMLVDERTISQSEHTGLFFEAAAGIRFIGSRTAGANGDVTVLTLPGGLTMSFSGHDVRHADGRQLQRVGLPIDVAVKPTIKGVQAGRDEVLERALSLLRDGR
jgi:C-terminal processing protease CtpA/Prc